jgi:hypothetical protein
MHWRFITRKQNPLDGRDANYLKRHPTLEIREGMYEALKPIARKRGLTVNQLIASEAHTMLMNLLLQEDE